MNALGCVRVLFERRCGTSLRSKALDLTIRDPIKRSVCRIERCFTRGVALGPMTYGKITGHKRFDHSQFEGEVFEFVHPFWNDEILFTSCHRFRAPL